eukprot:5025161-Prymnesium_polylepis.1
MISLRSCPAKSCGLSLANTADIARVVCLNGEYQLTLHHPSLSRDIRIARSSVDRLPLEERFGHEPVPGVVVGSE